jgi:hypothetical protein
MSGWPWAASLFFSRYTVGRLRFWNATANQPGTP